MAARTRHDRQSSHSVARSAPCRVDAQKKSLRASERNAAARQAWLEQVLLIDAERLVFVDESGCHRAMTPRYGWAKRGQRAYGVVPRNRGPNTTILAALSRRGVQAAMTLPGPADTLAFETFVEQVLVPTLQPRQVVAGALWAGDNLSIHKSEKTQRLIESCGWRLLFLPPYSPDFSPIEQAWSKLKTRLRRVGARVREVLEEAIAEGLDLITAQDAQGWFRHCGYQLCPQLL